MASARDRHIQYYLSHATLHPDDWDWFDNEWPQISQRIWNRLIKTTNAELSILTLIASVHHFQMKRGLWSEGLKWNTLGKDIAEALGNHQERMHSLINLGWYSNALGQRAQAIRYFDGALALAISNEDNDSQGSILNSLGAIYLFGKETDIGISYLRESLSIRKNAGDHLGEALVLINLGEAHLSLEEHQDALSFFQEALSIIEEKDFRQYLPTVLNNIASTYYALEKIEDAKEFYNYSLDLKREMGDRAGEITTLNNLGAIFFHNKEYKQALEIFTTSLTVSRKIGFKRGEAITLNNLAYVYLELALYSKALNHFETALEIASQINEGNVKNMAFEGIQISREGFAKQK